MALFSEPLMHVSGKSHPTLTQLQSGIHPFVPLPELNRAAYPDKPSGICVQILFCTYANTVIVQAQRQAIENSGSELPSTAYNPVLYHEFSDI